jgi:hypothetical protein
MEVITRQVRAAVYDLDGQVRSTESPFKFFAIRTRVALKERAGFWKRTIERLNGRLPKLKASDPVAILLEPFIRALEVEQRWLADLAGTNEMGTTVVVIIDNKAHFGHIVARGTVHYASITTEGFMMTLEDPTQLPPEDWIQQWPGAELRTDDNHPRIQLDDGRLFWGIECTWHEIVPQPSE